MVVVPAGTGLLTETAHFTEQISRLAVHHVRAFQCAALANRPSNVVAGQITHAKRPHGEAKLFHRFVYLRRGATFVHQKAGLAAVLLDHAVANEAVAHARYNRCFLDFFTDRHHCGQHVFAGLGAADHLEQLHHVGRTEKVHADHILRTLRKGGNLVHIERGSVGRQNGARLHDFIEFLEDGFFDPHLFKDRFNHQVGLTNVVVAQRGRQECHALIVLSLLEFAFFDLRFVVLADGRKAAVQCLLFHLQHLDRDACIQEIHGDTATHGAGANDSHARNAALGRVFGDIGNFGGRAIGNENMTQCATLRRHHQVGENFTLGHHPLFKFLLGGGFYRIDTFAWRRKVLRHAFDHVACELEISITLGVLAGQVLDKWFGRAVGMGRRHLTGQSQSLFSQGLG